MKPGATTRPSTSSVLRAGSSTLPMATMRASRIATSVRRPGVPLPSTNVPPRMTRSNMSGPPQTALLLSLEPTGSPHRRTAGGVDTAVAAGDEDVLLRLDQMAAGDAGGGVGVTGFDGRQEALVGLLH